MLVTWLFILILLTILGSLGFGLFFMIRDSHDSTRTVRALSWRIGISVTFFVLLLVAAALGWIEPNTLTP